MTEALEHVKREFGRQAVILSTRTTTRGRVLGLGGSPLVEITAARDLAGLPPDLRHGTLPVRSERTTVADGAATLVAKTAMPKRTADALLTELGGLRSLVQQVLRETRRSQPAEIPTCLYDTYRRLIENAVADELARDLVSRVRNTLSAEQLTDPYAVRRVMADAMEAMLPVAGPIQLANTESPTIVALVGPTGVGKTTTIAKLAANFALRERRRVGLITIDTFRIAAVEQLRTYADIINIPLEVVSTPEGLAAAVRRLGGCELILIDTAGRSQRDRVRLDDLCAFFDAARPHEVHLVLSSAASSAVLQEALQQFKPLGVGRIVFTKLDEAVGFGAILACLQQAQAKLSYVTTGQDVPDDIRVAEPNAVAALILGDRASSPTHNVVVGE